LAGSEWATGGCGWGRGVVEGFSVVIPGGGGGLWRKGGGGMVESNGVVPKEWE